MLVLTRRQGQSVLIRLSPDLDPNTPIGEVFAKGPIEVAILGVDGKQIKVGIEAPQQLSVLRNELAENSG